MQNLKYKFVHTKKYYAYAILLSLLVCRESLVTYFIALLNKIPLMDQITSLIPFFSILCLLFFSYIKKMKKIIRVTDFFIVLFLLFEFLLTVFLYPQNIEYIIFNFNQYIIYCIPALFIGILSIYYDNDMFAIITKFSCISIILSYFLLYFYILTGKPISEDALGLSYAVLPNTLFVIAYYFFKKEKAYIFFACLGFIFALMCGSRGPTILIFTFISMCILINSKKKISVIFFLLMCILFYAGFFYSLAMIGSELVSNLGFSTRIFDIFLQGETFSHTSGRDYIYKYLLMLLDEKPLMGYGLFGEWAYVGWNAHQLYLEVLFEYGYILGSFLILLYICTIIKTIKNEKEKAQLYFVLIYVNYVLIQGFMSYSHLRPELFLLLGFCLKCNRMRKYN